ncbi:MAG TPA: hypothetical protein VJT32_05015 [bacterium]|nr:hypothetical protein [bacterium]
MGIIVASGQAPPGRPGEEVHIVVFLLLGLLILVATGHLFLH